MICYPNAKINLGLKIISRRADGFHNIESFFVPIPLCDILEVKRQPSLLKETKVTYSGLFSNRIKNDLVIRAFDLLSNDFPLDPVRIHLHKNIPIQSGLGGGSSDGAFMLIMLNNLFSLKLSNIQLVNYAKSLGSDCPFFIINQFSHVSSVGDKIKPLNYSFSGYYLVILKPKISFSTADIFSRFCINKNNSNLLKKFNLDPMTWERDLVNDLESVTFSLSPELQDIKEYLYSKGAIYASMSGSGSAIYGIFNKKPNIDKKMVDWFWESVF